MNRTQCRLERIINPTMMTPVPRKTWLQVIAIEPTKKYSHALAALWPPTSARQQMTP